MIKLVDLLKEQAPTKLPSPWTSDTQKDIYVAYHGHLLNKLGMSWETPVGEIEKKLKLVTDKQLEDMDFMGYFKQKGYDPNSAAIRQFQKDLNVDQMKTQSGEADFADGNFGAVTAMAALEKKLLPSVEKNRKQNGSDYVYANGKKNATIPKGISIPRTKVASADVGTQSVPN
tara:strand:- start:727 stop:1245 length:519 start_codon:yes stop_codon:yes gene_type:complete